MRLGTSGSGAACDVGLVNGLATPNGEAAPLDSPISCRHHPNEPARARERPVSDRDVMPRPPAGRRRNTSSLPVGAAGPRARTRSTACPARRSANRVSKIVVRLRRTIVGATHCRREHDESVPADMIHLLQTDGPAKPRPPPPTLRAPRAHSSSVRSHVSACATATSGRAVRSEVRDLRVVLHGELFIS